MSGSAADAARVDVLHALGLLLDCHIKSNEQRLGVLGMQDLEIARNYLRSALEKLPVPAFGAALGSAAFCCWVVGLGESLCKKPATHREPMSGWTYCAEHAKDVAEMFGYDQIDLLANDGTGNESHQSQAGGSPIQDSRLPLELITELRAVLNKLDDLLEAARGPGRYEVYKELEDARYHCGDALYAEERRISKPPNAPDQRPGATKV